MDENYELILFLLSKHYPEQDLENIDDYDLYDLFYDHYGVDADQFRELVEDLLPLCAEGISPLTEKKYRGFATGNTWLVHKEVK